MDAGVVALTLLLAAAVRADWRYRMLPNRLVVCGAVLVLSVAAVQGPKALWLALCGGLTGALLLLPLYATHGMAAGDVKLMGMAGVFLGVPGVLYGVLGTVLAGGYAPECRALDACKLVCGHAARRCLQGQQAARFARSEHQRAARHTDCGSQARAAHQFIHHRRWRPAEHRIAGSGQRGSRCGAAPVARWPGRDITPTRECCDATHHSDARQGSDQRLAHGA